MRTPREDVPEAHSRKPDPEQPWRYVCPDCGSHLVLLVRTHKRPPGKEYSPVNNPRANARRDRAKGFKCRACGERKMTLLDKQNNGEVREV